ncbi:hypothetical protein NPIL_304711 [Nephila pilipes]|uniref:Uncharacterized protein n=1 Tax=Nephila pilipes TaxID=299642 RepID=A0A8X6UKJ0_NEPPI|nr:hypothetical protein NPIL_304711 [Nephila pilipes]
MALFAVLPAQPRMLRRRAFKRVRREQHAWRSHSRFAICWLYLLPKYGKSLSKARRFWAKKVSVSNSAMQLDVPLPANGIMRLRFGCMFCVKAEAASATEKRWRASCCHGQCAYSVRNTDRMVAKRGSQTIWTPKGKAGFRSPALATLATKIGMTNLQVKSSFVEKFPE